MDDVPKELFDEVHDLALGIVNATMANDEAVAESVYLRLRELYQTKMENGEVHPFLTETLADFTLDTTEAIRLFKEAIAQCESFPKEPIHSKMLSLAETLVERARFEEAEAYLVAARQPALNCEDWDALKQIASLLEKTAKS